MGMFIFVAAVAIVFFKAISSAFDKEDKDV